MGLKIYLAGRCKGLDDEGRAWREDIVKQLEAVADWNGKTVNVFDPTKYFSYSEKKHKTQKQIYEFYMHKLSKCDLVIVNANGSEFSIGTAMECQAARDHKIPVIAFGNQDTYPWITEVVAQVTFESMHEAVDFIRDYYM